MTAVIKRRLALLVVLHLVVIAAGFISPVSPTLQDREFSFAPPTAIRFIDGEGNWHLRPFVYGIAPTPDDFSEYIELREQRYPLRFFASGPSYRFFGVSLTTHLVTVDAPGRLFLFGTDQYGRDLFARVLHGAQISLLAGVMATVISLALGTVLGGIAGGFGKVMDRIIMRLSEVFLALPWFYLLFAIRAFLPLHVSPESALLLLTVVIGTVGWARPARLVRGVVLSAKERNFVLAARNSGASEAYVLRRHLLPQAWGVILTQATLLVPQYALAEVALSFVGLGVGEPAASWGTILAALQQLHVLQSCWWMFLPVAVMFVFFMSYFLLADALESQLKSAQF